MSPMKSSLSQSAASSGTTINGGWNDPAVAAAQANVVARELQSIFSRGNNPYHAFLGALNLIPTQPGMLLLDVGCGVGHYGSAMKARHPELQYWGVDASAAMIAKAREREPELRFSVMDFYDSPFEQADIVLASQVIEVLDDPFKGLDIVLAAARGWVILHKLRLAPESRVIEEPTYAGHVGKIQLWNMADVLEPIRRMGRKWHMVDWLDRYDIITFVVWPAKKLT